MGIIVRFNTEDDSNASHHIKRKSEPSNTPFEVFFFVPALSI